MTKNYYCKKAEKLLREVEMYRASLDYYLKIQDCTELDIGSAREISSRVKYLTHTIAALEHAIEMLSPTERDVVTRIFLKGENLDDVCDSCALERSSIYRYRASALRKIALALYGAA